MLPPRRRRVGALVACLLSLTIAADLDRVSAEVPKEAPANPPKLQKLLQAAADNVRLREAWPVRVTGASVGQRLLVIHFEPSKGATFDLALKGLREEKWDRELCADKDTLHELNEEHIMIRMTLSRDGEEPETVADVTAASCSQEALIEPAVSSIIGGIAFGPKPSREAALKSIYGYLKRTLLDVESAKIECGDISNAAWIKPTLEPRKYGYFVRCEVNAKNAYGAYVGYQQEWFRLNGDELEQLDYLPSNSGIMAAAQ